MIRLHNQKRALRLVDEAITRVGLDLHGLRVLTEAASGAFVCTALAAARAGADAVYAITGDSVHGTAQEVIAYGSEWAEAFGLEKRVCFSTEPAASFASESDIVTNLGFVRPIDAGFVERLPLHAVICLMWEPWEFRAGDIDVEACRLAGIPVIGTRETDDRLRIFDYVGMLAIKLLLEAGVECFRSRILLIGSDPFGTAIHGKLAALGADVEWMRPPASETDLDGAWGSRVERADALILAEHRDRRELVGETGGIRPERFLAGGCQIIHISGVVDDCALQRASVEKNPDRHVREGHMAVTTDYTGIRSLIDLHVAGLRVGELAVRCRLSGGSCAEAVKAAEASGLGMALNVIQKAMMPHGQGPEGSCSQTGVNISAQRMPSSFNR